LRAVCEIFARRFLGAAWFLREGVKGLYCESSSRKNRGGKEKARMYCITWYVRIWLLAAGPVIGLWKLEKGHGVAGKRINGY